MVDHIVDTSERRGGVDIRVGVGRRRRWRAADKGRIVAESYAPGAVVSEVARRARHHAAASGDSGPLFQAATRSTSVKMCLSSGMQEPQLAPARSAAPSAATLPAPAAVAPVFMRLGGFALARRPLALPSGTWWTRVAVAGGWLGRAPRDQCIPAGSTRSASPHIRSATGLHDSSNAGAGTDLRSRRL